MGRRMGIPHLFLKTWRASRFPPPYPSGGPWASCRHPRTISFRLSSVEEEICRAAAEAADSGSPETAEAVIHELVLSPVKRLFFDPDEGSSILRRPDVPFEESVSMAVDSSDPYSDFRQSMAEMVAAHGLRDWAWLEALLAWYLRVNGKTLHGFIVGAFLDLLLDLSFSSCTSSSSASSSPSRSISFDVDEEEANGQPEETSLPR